MAESNLKLSCSVVAKAFFTTSCRFNRSSFLTSIVSVLCSPSASEADLFISAKFVLFCDGNLKIASHISSSSSRSTSSLLDREKLSFLDPISNSKYSLPFEAAMVSLWRSLSQETLIRESGDKSSGKGV